MYPIERYLGFLKRMNHNKCFPEGSIAEQYIANECVDFVSRYLQGVETRLNRMPRIEEGKLYSPCNKDRHFSREMLEQIHAYVLNNLDIVAEYHRKHIEELPRGKTTKKQYEVKQKKEFPCWFQGHVQTLLARGEFVPEEIIRLSSKPHLDVNRYGIYCVNGYKFHTKEIEEKRITQNSGIVQSFQQSFYSSAKDQNPVEAQLIYYGILEDIIEIYYGRHREDSYVMFKVRWCAANQKKDDLGFQIVNKNKEIYDDEKFMFAAQAQQCFYVEDLTKSRSWVVLRNQPRSYFEDPEDSLLDDDNEYVHPVDMVETDQPIQNFTCNHDIFDDFSITRNEVPNVCIDTS